jgi:bifunctional N6-L-threonylcarbamoyladenine synthase / protein kinase Bud32
MKTERGAEALLKFQEHSVIKERIVKPYRNPQLDERLRKIRNRKEAKILLEAPVRVPKVLQVTDYSITMERINGPRLRDAITIDNAAFFGEQLGKMLSALHEKNIIHGDLTTSNVLVENGTELVLIDFGLGYQSPRFEDRAVDLHVLRETVEGTHLKEATSFWKALTESYADEKILKILEEVESRGRYKAKY